MREVVKPVVEKVETWLSALIGALPNMAVAALVLVVAWFAGHLSYRASTRLLARMHVSQSARHLLGRVVHLAVLAGGVVVALSVLNLDKAAMSFLAGAGIVGLALGFAFQDLAANFISGIALALRKPFHIGDVIETEAAFGTIAAVDLRSTTVDAFDGRTIIIPNRMLFESPVTNHSTSRLRRLDLECGISYGDDLALVHKVATEALEGVSGRVPDRPAEVFFDGFGDSSINFVGFVWFRFRGQRDLLAVRSEAVMALKRAFDEAGITIPFPIRTLDFGIKGGERLAEVVALSKAEAS